MEKISTLPWYSADSKADYLQPESHIWSDDEQHPIAVCSATENMAQNCRYISRAANAYPLLVAALEALSSATHSACWDEHNAKARQAIAEASAADALLHELKTSDCAEVFTAFR